MGRSRFRRPHLRAAANGRAAAGAPVRPRPVEPDGSNVRAVATVARDGPAPRAGGPACPAGRCSEFSRPSCRRRSWPRLWQPSPPSPRAPTSCRRRLPIPRRRLRRWRRSLRPRAAWLQTQALTVDAQGNVYVAALTSVANLPGMGSAFQPALDRQDTVVMKFDPAGRLIWATYLGGNDARSSSACSGRHAPGHRRRFRRATCTVAGLDSLPRTSDRPTR